MSMLEKIFRILPIKYEFASILLSLTVVLLVYLLSKLFFAKKQIFLQQGVPTIKLRRWNFLGHGTQFSHIIFLHNELYDIHVYALQSLDAVRIIFKKDELYVGWILSVPFVILFKANTVEALLSSTQVLEKAWSYKLFHHWLGTGLLTSKGQKWKSRRKIITPAFHFDILKDFLPIINEKAEILNGIIKEATSKEWIDINRLVSLCSLDIICETTLGVNINAQKHEDSEYIKAIFRLSTVTMERVFSPTMWLDWLFFRSKVGQEHLKDLDIVHSFTRKIIREKKEALKVNADLKERTLKPKRQALMDLLLNHHMIYEDFTEEDVREEVDTFAFEGHDTTAAALMWSFFMIGLYPHVQKNIHEELDMIFGDDERHITTEELKDMKYLECVIKEVLRLYPSVPLFGRRITEDIDIDGVHIPKGSECGVFAYGLHRDPDVFPNPEFFDPERFFPENAVGRHPYAYVPFAAGPRNCIGQRFAMMELKTVLATVLRSFIVQSLDTRDKILPALSVVSRPSHPIRIKVVSRSK